MNLFHDTNVLIAYCFIHDRWKGKAEAILRDDFTHFTSDKVINEFEEKENEIIEDFYSKLVELSEKLRRSGKNYFNVDEKRKIVNKADKNIKPLIIEFLDKEISYPVSKNDLAGSIQELYLTAIKTERIRYNKLIQKFKKIHSRDTEYPDLETELKKLDIHNGRRDRGILLDAHDLAILCEFALNFVSTDDDICGELRKEILRILELEGIIDLRYYTSF